MGEISSEKKLNNVASKPNFSDYLGGQSHQSVESIVLPKPGYMVQPRLEIGEVNDPLEREADRIADQVMSSSAHATMGGMPIRVQRLTGGDSAGSQQSAPPSVERTLAGGGRPLEPVVRHDMEQRFGYDFSDVRVHDDALAKVSTRDITAHAYTAGSHIVFASGKYSPGTQDGQHLLAHELTHVVQQSVSTTAQAKPITPEFVQRWDAYDHIDIGDDAATGGSGTRILLDCHKDFPGRRNPVDTWPQPWIQYKGNKEQENALQLGLTYGEISALSGDLYADFDAINRAPLREVIDLIPLIHGRTTTTTQFEQATGARYLELAKKNAGHFSTGPTGNNTRDIWRDNHTKAIEAALAGNANLAWGINAAGDHFLEDAFTSGHMKVNKYELQRQGILGNIRAKVLHDLDNKFGVDVTNDRGDTWTAFGEGETLDGYNRTFVLEAVKLSKKDITDALNQGTSYTIPAKFPAEYLIPRPVDPGHNKWNSQDYEDMKKNVAKHEGPGVASGQFTDDDYLRNWINRMDNSALGRQSETDIRRMLDVLLDGIVTDDDMKAIKRLLDSITDTQMKGRIGRSINFSKLTDLGQRTKLRIWFSQ